MVVELWLLWSLLAGKPADVDSFLQREQCEAALTEGLHRLDESREAAKAGGAPKEIIDRLNSVTLYGCTPARAGFPKADS
jgi:hypothetical protein